MADWSTSEKASPSVKFEASPAESFLSMPGEMYPPLFGTPSAATASTLNPMDIMTPQSFPEDKNSAELSILTGLTAGIPESPTSGTCTPTPSEKKQSKKRKSWGQVLPEPKTNLPPRKRAKTEDEKEQRRVERVLRNRRAAQSSRERKRQEVEALEQRNKHLEAQLANLAQTNMMLCDELNKMRGSSGVVARAAPVTFSQELFSSHDGHSRLRGQSRSSLDELMITSQQPHQNTINPTSLSPALSPVPDEDEDEDDEDEEADEGEALLGPKVTPDLTQHPAEVLCSDLQCQSAEASRTWAASQQPLPRALSALLYCQLTLLLTSTSTMLSICRRPLTQIAMSLKAGFSLPPTPALLNTILWLVTKPSPSRTPTSTLTSSSTKNPPPPRAGTPRPNSRSSSTSTTTTLRLKVLRKILTCSPMLARPLTDATMAALRLVRSEEASDVNRVNGDGEGRRDGSPLAGPAEREKGSSPSLGAGWPQGAALPSKEVLLTLLWAIKVEQRRISTKKEREAIQSRPGRLSGALGTSAPPPTSLSTTMSKQKYVLRVEQQQRKGGVVQWRHYQNGGKRRRIG